MAMETDRTVLDNPLGSMAPKPSRAPLVFMTVLMLGAAGSTGYVWQKWEKERAGSARIAANLAEAQQKLATSEQDKSKLTLDKALLENEKVQLTAARDELAKSVQAKDSELAQLKGTYDSLQDKMKDEIAHGDIRLTQSGGKLRVDLVDKILFDSGEAKISKRGESVLARVGAILAAIDDKQIQVSGHTDAAKISEKLAGEFPTNWELSGARAINVVRFLQEKAGVPGGRLVASGYGEYQPIAKNHSPAGRARNRRIEILLTPLLQPKKIGRNDLKNVAATNAKE